MKALLIAALVGLTSISAFADAAADLETRAQAAYDARDFTGPGIQSAQLAANLFGQAVGATSDPAKIAQLRVHQSAACFFVGDAAQDNSVKITQFWNGYTLANDVIVKTFGITDVTAVSDAQIQGFLKLSKDQLLVLGEALYIRGINLGQWGQANGIMESLNKWPDLKADMELMLKIGAKGLHEYGAYRTLGRGLFKIPALLGGDVARATKYLQAAVQGSAAAGTTFSINGFNNLFYADVLKDAGKDAEGKKLLQDYIAAAQANPNLLLGYAPETKNAVREALDMLKSW